MTDPRGILNPANLSSMKGAGKRMTKEKIGLVQEAPVDKRRVKDSCEKRTGNLTVVYSTEGVVGSEYIHNCECRLGNTVTSTSTQTSGQRLTREEIERLPKLVEWVAQYY